MAPTSISHLNISTTQGVSAAAYPVGPGQNSTMNRTQTDSSTGTSDSGLSALWLTPLFVFVIVVLILR